MPKDRSKLAGVIAILAVGGVIYPLVGASLVAMLCLDFGNNADVADKGSLSPAKPC
ncbi:MAG: hypothetical protein ABWZ83_05690 [Mesorhizobium sp.]